MMEVEAKMEALSSCREEVGASWMADQDAGISKAMLEAFAS